MIVPPGNRVRPPTVLHVAQPTIAGVARYVTAASADQLDRGWRAVVACPDGGWLADELAAHRVPRVGWSATRSPGAASPVEAARLFRIIAAVAPDVVHLHSSKAGLVGRLVLRGRLPTLFSPHGWSWLAATGTTARLAAAWERAAVRWTDEFVLVGVGEEEHARAQRLGGRRVVIRSGVDLARFAPAGPDDRAAARARHGIRDDVPLAVCIGRVSRQKGQDVLLRSWPAVRDRVPAAQLRIIGPGVLRDAERHPVPEGVRFEPSTPDPRQWLAAADLVVLPSRWEGLSLTLLEALASGRPVVAADVAGLKELVTPQVGQLVPPDCPAVLAAAIAVRLADRRRLAAEATAAAALGAQFDARRTWDLLAATTAAAARAGGTAGPQRVRLRRAA